MATDITQRTAGANWVAQVGGAIFFLALGWLGMIVFLKAIPPDPYAPAAIGFADYDRTSMGAATTPEHVAAEQEKLLACGSRFPGQEGYYRAQAYIEQRYRDAGLEMMAMDFEVAVPVTSRAELLLNGKPSEVAIYPFMPNHVQPMNSPPDGIRGDLMLLNDKILATAESFTGKIALIDVADDLPKGFGVNWVRYAELGFAAVVVTSHEGLDKVKWESLAASMTARNPVNYVRLAADPGILALNGKPITMHVRTAFEPRATRTLIGCLRGAEGNREAVVITAAYDAGSILPDLAPGALQAVLPAVQLAILDGLLPHRQALRRDVIFVCSGAHISSSIGIHNLLAAIGDRYQVKARHEEVTVRIAKHQAAHERLQTLVALFDDPEFFVDSERTEQALSSLPAAASATFEAQHEYTLNRYVFERSEDQLQARIILKEHPEQSASGPLYDAYRAQRVRYDAAFSSAGYRPAKLLREFADYVRENGVRERLLTRLTELRDFHQDAGARDAQALAVNELFDRYESWSAMTPDILPTETPGERELLSFTVGGGADYRTEQPVLIRNQLLTAVQHLDLTAATDIAFHGVRHGTTISAKTGGIPLHCNGFLPFSYTAFSVVHTDRADSYRRAYYPVALPFMVDLATMRIGLQVVGETVLSAAYGNGAYPIQKPESKQTIRGSVYVANVGQSIIPNFPMARALVSCRAIAAGSELASWTAGSGWLGFLPLFADPYGDYCVEDAYAGVFTSRMEDVSPDATFYDDNGLIAYIKDQGRAQQAVYKSMALSIYGGGLDGKVNLIVFRAVPVTILDHINPQTLKAYSAIELIRGRGLADFDSKNTFKENAITTAFLKPDERFYVTFKAGSADNELVAETRAFMLGTKAGELASLAAGEPLRGHEISGDGYLAARHPLLLDIPERIASSMILINGKRLRLQNRDGIRMADQRTEAFQETAIERLSAAEDEALPALDRVRLARDAVTYATLNHPVLRSNVTKAIWGVVWYLCLLVPFVFFFEKLAFGFPDIRKQIAAHVAIFLIAFTLLKLLHPAFEMIRSSVMILLGFVIMMISTGITILFSSKFQENLEEIRKRQGRVSAAEVNAIGAITTAFLLGLNNMHRRRVRTGLTCATLVLLTFVMICFTSVQSNLVDRQTAIGKAPFQGFLLKNEKFKQISGAEAQALETKYGDRFDVVTREFLIGTEHWTTRERDNAQIEIVRREEGGSASSAQLHSALRFAWNEPLRSRLKLLTGRWFTEEDEKQQEGAVPVLISDWAAGKLGITPQMAAAGADSELNGQAISIVGIFDTQSLGALRDLDDRSLLPFDITAMRIVNKEGGQIVADDTDPLIDPARIILLPRGYYPFTIERGQKIISSVAVVLPDDLNYKDSRQVIDTHLEQSGRSTYFGIEGYAFRGKRARESSIAGILDMLIPLIIAALTVLNTMKGSVYERRDEIYVYNAVGIAPKHIFFMFFAEAFVYAVVGSVLGYILSQGVGRVLIAMDMTGGLNMTFTSLATIWVSITISLFVFASTLSPALTAKRIAAPSDDAGWQLPEPVGDILRFTVPFTFGHRDRIAVLGFFERFFLDHGSGSSGPFFAGEPLLRVGRDTDPLNQDGYIPELVVMTWLKPFDLGVSQEVRIILATDPETTEYIPTIELVRKSGTLDKWVLLNKRFVKRMRKHFLHWRAVSEEDKQEMFGEAEAVMRRTVPTT